jgi:hypothetical protein
MDMEQTLESTSGSDAGAAADARRIDPLDPNELLFWAKAFGASEAEVLNAVDRVGFSAAKVRQYLDGHARRRRDP